MFRSACSFFKKFKPKHAQEYIHNKGGQNPRYNFSEATMKNGPEGRRPYGDWCSSYWKHGGPCSPHQHFYYYHKRGGKIFTFFLGLGLGCYLTSDYQITITKKESRKLTETAIQTQDQDQNQEES